MEIYESALALLEEATRLMETTGDTLVAAHIATPIALIEDLLLDQRRRDIA